MKNLILVTHGEFAKGILTSVHLILGTAEAVKTVGITEKETIQDIVAAIQEITETLPEKSPVIIVTDIAGGSTTQAAIQIMIRREKTYVITGLNLGMLLELLCADISDEPDEDTLTNILRDTVKNSRETIQLTSGLSNGTTSCSGEDSGEL